eukprot:8861070-Pyramimonas_sp.AAC.1
MWPPALPCDIGIGASRHKGLSLRLSSLGGAVDGAAPPRLAPVAQRVGLLRGTSTEWTADRWDS